MSDKVMPIVKAEEAEVEEEELVDPQATLRVCGNYYLFYSYVFMP